MVTNRRAVVAAVLLGIAALACTPAPTSSPTADTAQPAQPEYGGRISLRTGIDIVNYDFHLSSRREMYYTSLAYNRLVRFKSGPDMAYTDLVMEPELAERWEVSPDGKAVTFNLRKGVKFGNLPPVNGREMTSADVKFSFEYDSRTGEFKDKKLPASPNDYMLKGLERIDTPDPYTAVVRFAEPFVPFINYAASSNSLAILPREIYDQDGDFKQRTVGTGPFQLDLNASQTGTRVVWKKHQGYWESGKPYVDEVYHIILKDDGTARAAFQSKQLDLLTEGMNNVVAQEVKRSNPNVMFLDYPSPEPPFIWVNVRPGTPLADERLRRAFSLAVDRQEMIKTFAGDKGQWALAGALPSTFTQEEIKQIVRYDLDAAKRLLAEAGHPSGFDLELTYPGNTYGESYVSLLQLLQAQVKKAGINLTLKSLDVPANTASHRTGQFQVSAGGTKGLEPDVDSWVYAAFHPSSTNNYGGVDDPALNQLLDAQRKETNPTRRNEMVRDAVRLINEKVLGNLVFFYQGESQFWHPHVKGFHPYWANTGKTYGPNVSSVWLDK